MKKYGFPESDWKLYKSKIADWQEGYMNKLCNEYIELLSSDETPSEKFWSLVGRIKEDRYKTGVIVRNSRSEMVQNILNLIQDGAITITDLEEFSDELKEKIKFICDRYF